MARRQSGVGKIRGPNVMKIAVLAAFFGFAIGLGWAYVLWTRPAPPPRYTDCEWRLTVAEIERNKCRELLRQCGWPSE
jgi:hypothetical protein